MIEDLDGKDIEILNMLRTGKTPLRVICNKLGLSKATVSRRITKMEESGIIKEYPIDIDLASMGIMKSLVMMQIVGSPVMIIIEQLKKYEDIGRIFKTFGDHNLVCEIYTHNVDELYEMIQTKLLKMPSIRNVEVDILLDSVDMNVNADLKLFRKGLKD